MTSAPATHNRGGLVCETDLPSNSDAGVGLEGQDRVHELASAAVDAAEPARSHARGEECELGGVS